jgi:Family of unknown function (DUF5899)
MEFVIPLVALGGLYIVSKNTQNENFTGQRGIGGQEQISGTSDYTTLPNTDIPNKNYPAEYPIVSQENELTSKLSTVNKFDSPHVYTDKYFNPNNNRNAVSSYATLNNGASGQNDSGNPSYTKTPYYSLTGEKVDSSHFQHDNMVPYFGGHIRSRNLNANSNESTLDNYQGQGSQIFSKVEQSPLFAPGENYNYAYGAPNNNDFYQSRVNPSLRMANIKPFEEQKVAPGLGLGYTTDGLGGFNAGMGAREMWLPKTVDEMRVNNHQKSSEHGLLGREGPAISNITTRGEHAPVNKNRQDTAFEMGHDRLFTTLGIETAPTSRAITIEKHMNRPETHTSYAGGAGSAVDGTYKPGEYMDSKHIDLGPVPYGIATSKTVGTDADYERKSKYAYPNNRTANDQGDYFGAVGGAIGAVIAPLLDVLRPSRKENTIGNLRPYENAHTKNSSSYLFNPADRLGTTIRETTENNQYIYGVNAGQHGGAYLSTAVQSIPTERDTTTVFYAGGSSAANGAKLPRTYDAEYNQRNNDIKSSTIDGRMVPGNMDLLNADITMRNREGDHMLKNNRAITVTDGPKLYYSPDQMGIKTTGDNTLYQSIQLDRNSPEILDALKQNPYNLSITGNQKSPWKMSSVA